MENPKESEEIEMDELDVEDYAGRNQARKPKTKTYIIRVDKTQFRVDQPDMTGRAILSLASKLPPEEYRSKQKLHGGEMKTVGLDESVDFRAPGVERFVTLKLENTEG